MLDWLYLSPHLDDVALSCGGQIHQAVARGERVLVVTICAGDEPVRGLSEFARGMLRGWKLAPGSVMAKRRKEDQAAWRHLGTELVHWEFLEAPYRRDPETDHHLYPGPRALFGPLAAGDAETRDEIERHLGTLPSSRRVVGPLAVGGHVDHQVVRRAAETCFGPRLDYFEDYPYARRRGRLAQLTRPREGWQPQTVPLTEEALAARCAAIACYGSQVPSLFRNRRRMERLVRRYARRVGGERLWRRIAPDPV